MARRVHRDVAQLFVSGLVAIAIAAVIVYLGTSVQNGGAMPLKKYTYVVGEFDDVGTLKVAQKVSENGVRVGVVSSIVHERNRAVVTVRLDGTREVYQDATLTLGNESAVGRKYVILDPGTPEAGGLGEQRLPTTQTSAGRDLNDLMAVFDERTRTGVRTLSQQLGGGALGHGEDLQSTMRASDELVEGLGVITRATSSRKARLGELISDADRLVGRFDERRGDIRGLLRTSETTLEAVAVDDGKPLKSAVGKLPATLSEVRKNLDLLNPALADVAVTVRQLRPSARDLAEATPALRGFLRESLSPLGKVPAVAKSAEPAVRDLEALFADARPVVPVVARLLQSADPLLTTLAPYAPDAGRTVSQHDMLSGHFSPTEHFFSAMLAFPGLQTLSLPDPLASVDPYPGPGKAFGPTVRSSR